MVEETFEPGMTVSLVARRHGVAPSQLFTWRRLVAQGSLTAAGSGEEVVPASVPGSFSEGEYCRWTSWAQTDPNALCARSGLWIHHEVRLVQLLRVAFE